MHIRRSRGQGVPAIRSRRKWLDVEIDQADSIFGDIAAVGDHHGHRFADENDLLRRENIGRDVRWKAVAGKLQRQAVCGQNRPQIRQRVDGVHARVGPRGADVDRFDDAVSDRAAQKRGLQLAGPMDVVDEMPGTVQ